MLEKMGEVLDENHALNKKFDLLNEKFDRMTSLLSATMPHLDNNNIVKSSVLSGDSIL